MRSTVSAYFCPAIPVLVAVLSLAAVACGTSSTEPGTDTGPDTPAEDVSVDAAGDTGDDASEDASTTEWTPCSAPSDCFLASNGCCDVCGQPELADVDAIHQLDTAMHRGMVCDDPNPICPGCPSMRNPRLFAECVDSQCVVGDVITDAVSECTADEDCRLRTPDCCECGAVTAPDMLIAIRVDAETEWRSRVCDPTVDCGACEPGYSTAVQAACSRAGRCIVEYLED